MAFDRNDVKLTLKRHSNDNNAYKFLLMDVHEFFKSLDHLITTQEYSQLSYYWSVSLSLESNLLYYFFLPTNQFFLSSLSFKYLFLILYNFDHLNYNYIISNNATYM